MGIACPFKSSRKARGSENGVGRVLGGKDAKLGVSRGEEGRIKREQRSMPVGEGEVKNRRAVLPRPA